MDRQEFFHAAERSRRAWRRRSMRFRTARAARSARDDETAARLAALRSLDETRVSCRATQQLAAVLGDRLRPG